MKRTTALVAIVCLQYYLFQLFAASPINIAESTVRVAPSSEEAFYYSFSKGDQVQFSFEEENGEPLQKIEIVELPSSSKFMDYQTKKIGNKTIAVTKTAVYKFCFSNSALSSRICKFKIRRTPESEATKEFDTSVRWRTVFDTTYTSEKERYIVKSDTIIANLTNQVAKVNPTMNFNGNKNTFNFKLPENTVAWSYYIGVEQAGQDAFESAKSKVIRNAGSIVAHIPEYGPMAALALGGISYFTQLQTGEDIDFYIVDNNNVKPFIDGRPFVYIKKGKVINDFSRITYPLKGTYHICLLNDNAIESVSVTVKITAIVVNQKWGIRPVQRMNIEVRKEPYR